MSTDRRNPLRHEPPQAARPFSAQTLERLREENVVFDGVTGLPIHPFEDPARIAAIERIERLGVIYLQIGKFFGFEELYGWEVYDRVLVAVAQGLREDAAATPLAAHLVSIRYSGSDGFYLLFDLPPPSRGKATPVPSLEAEASRLQANAIQRLRDAFGGTTVDMMSVHVASHRALDNPKVRPSRHLLRNMQEATQIVTLRQTREKRELCAALKAVMSHRGLKAAFQPVCHLPDGDVLGYEALIRGPRGTAFEQANVLFAIAHENDMDVELETLCLETIFAHLPRAVSQRRLFVNASATLLRHPVFLDDRNLTAINRSHGDVVVEISEKEMVGDYTAFGGILETIRGSKLKIAIDDAGSGYSGLESILHLRPDYIKVADSLVRNLEGDPIKREIITSLAGIGQRIGASLIAEGIERDEERQALVALDIPYGQGYLLGRPSFQVPARVTRN